MNHLFSEFKRYLLALLGIALAVSLCLALIPVLESDTPYLFFYPTLLIITIRLGLGPGIVASAAGILAVETWLLPPIGQPALTWAFALRGLIIFAVTLTSGYIAARLNRAKNLAQKQSEDLRRSQILLRAVLNNAPDPVFVTDSESHMVLTNPAMLETVGRPADQVIGKNELELFADPAIARQLIENNRRVMESGKTLVVEERVPTAHGERIFYTSKSPYYDASGHIAGIIGLARDITGRKRIEENLREQESILRLFVRHTPAAVAMFDRRMNFMVYSERWLSDHGLGRQDLTGRNLYEVLPDIRDEWKAVHQRCLAGASEKMDEDEYPRLDGRVQWVRWETHPWRTGEGRIGGIIIFVEDITARRQAELALRLSEDRYRSLVELSPDAIFVVRNGRIAFLNQAAQNLFGASAAEQILERPAADLFRSDQEPLSRELLAARPDGRPLPRIESSVVRLDGEVRQVELTAAPFTNQGGPAFQVVLRDITERKKAQAVMERYYLISRYARDPLLLISLDGAILEANQAAVNFYGYTREELLRLQIQDLRFDKNVEMLRRQLEEAGAGGILFETVHVRKNGTTVPVEVSSRGGTIEGQKVLLSVIRDITQRKQAETALQEANRRKDEFLAMLAHELRNPLAPIRNAVHLMRLQETGDPALRRRRDMIERQVTHMAHLLDDLLDVSRITSGKITLHKRPVALGDILTQVAETIVPQAEARMQRLELSPMPAELRVNGDPDRLSQIFGNLLNNASKFTGAGGRIRVNGRRENGEAVIRVSDTGIGIAPDMLNRVFELFTQVNRELDRSQGGLGIGLTIVRDLAQMHGGTVAVRSPGIGQGSEFEVRLPLLAESHPESLKPSAG